MILDALSEEKLELLYLRLQEAGIPSQPFSRKSVKDMFAQYCRDKQLPVNDNVLYILLYKDNFVIKKQESLPIAGMLEGVYVPEFKSTSKEAFGLMQIENQLKKHSGKKITLLILTD